MKQFSCGNTFRLREMFSTSIGQTQVPTGPGKEKKKKDLHVTEMNTRMWRPLKDDKDNASGLNINCEFTKCKQRSLWCPRSDYIRQMGCDVISMCFPALTRPPSLGPPPPSCCSRQHSRPGWRWQLRCQPCAFEHVAVCLQACCLCTVYF